jgi:hypothetical protein
MSRTGLQSHVAYLSEIVTRRGFQRDSDATGTEYILTQGEQIDSEVERLGYEYISIVSAM